MVPLIKFKVILLILSLNDIAFGLEFAKKTKLSNFYPVTTKYKRSSVQRQISWILQPLDHFNTSDKRVWSMKYFISFEHFKPGGPIIFQITAKTTLHFGLVTELANETKGAILTAEHRYYGQNFPYNKAIKDLKYLSSKQALADIETLLKHLKNTPTFNAAKIIAIGSGYGGNLAAWARMLYPNLIDAAHASSAPLLAEVDFNTYGNQVAENLRKYGGDTCLVKIREILKRTDELLKTSEGIEQLKIQKNICSSTNMSISQNQYFYFDTNTYKYMVAGESGIPWMIKQYCNHIIKNSRFPLLNSYDFRTLKLDSESDGCLDYDFNRGLPTSETNKVSYNWMYQMCSEFGYFQTNSASSAQIAHTPIEYYFNGCAALFGPEFNETSIRQNIDATNRLYGGRNPKVTHVIFTNGALDPWKELGVLTDLSPDAPAKVIPNATKSNELFTLEEDGSEELKNIQSYVKNLIKSWIGLGSSK